MEEVLQIKVTLDFYDTYVFLPKFDLSAHTEVY